MSIVIGIDAGISSTKIIGIDSGKRIKSPMSVTGSDALSSIHGALGKYIYENNIALEEIEQIMITGVGAKGLQNNLFNCPTTHVDEFRANGLGARFDSGLDHMIVVSMGTGTSFVRVDGDDIKHIGGIAMGGGTLMGLAHLLLNTTSIYHVNEMAGDGDISHCNLRMIDVCDELIDGLDMYTTASLFGDAHQSMPTDNDIAAGLVRMVLETIGSCAVMSQSNGGFKDFVLIGKLTLLSACNEIFTELEDLYHVHFHMPKYALYCTALGAALSYKYENE